MVGLENLFSGRNDMAYVSASSQAEPDKTMDEKEWKDYLAKIDDVLEVYKEIAVQDGKDNLERQIKSVRKTGQCGLMIYPNLCRWVRHLSPRR